jgi:hypothetical protein
VTAMLTKLQPDTTYYYQLQAKNGKGTNEDGAILHFTTTGPGILSTSVSSVAATSGTLDATLEPHNVPTSYRFEYDTKPYAPEEAPHGIAVPASAEAIGSTPGAVKVEQHIQGLTGGTTYYYRVVTVGEVEGKAEESGGEGHSFTTQGAGEFALPDHRQYEMVSPPDKYGATLDGIGEPGGYNGGVIQAAADGNALTYVANSPTEPEPAGYTNETQVYSTRGASGWSTHDLALPHAGATDGSVGPGIEYRFFGEDLSSAIVQPFGGFIALAPQATEQTAYLQNEDGGAFTPLVTNGEGVADDTAKPFQPFGQFLDAGAGHTCPTGLICGPYFVGATPNDSHVALTSEVALTQTPLPENSSHETPAQLYEWNAGEPASRQLQLVSVLPEGEGGGGPPATGASLGGRSFSEDARGAISADGSRVFFSTTQNALYMRDVPAGKTLRLDLPAAGCETCGTGSPAGLFQLASPDGERVLFTDHQKLTSDSGANAEKADLYECVIGEKVADQPACELTDVTPRDASGESAGVQGGVLGESEDGSYLYFVANGVLENIGAKVVGAVRGSCDGKVTAFTVGAQCNLYVRHEGKTSLVAVLSGGDYSDVGTYGPTKLNTLTARVSPNGLYLAFMSDRELTGYDNHDATSGEPHEELYEYDAATGRTSCASCDPSGARPEGEEFGQEGDNMPLAGEKVVWEPNSWLAATIPGWTPFELATARYQSRYLSNTGRLFFNARSALVPNDVNNQWDVYEYEPEGVGTCTSATGSGSDVFKPAHAFETEVEGKKQTGEEGAGCVGLISNGESKDESAFLDASATGGKDAEGAEGGGDVFFLTTAKLAPQDVDDSYDVYDAHECTTASPCTQGATSPPPCENEASCKPAPESQPGIYGPPASATFSGPGNLTPAPVVPPKKVVKKAAKCKSGFVRRTVKPKRGKGKAECVRRGRAKKRQGKR